MMFSIITLKIGSKDGKILKNNCLGHKDFRRPVLLFSREMHRF